MKQFSLILNLLSHSITAIVWLMTATSCSNNQIELSAIGSTPVDETATSRPSTLPSLNVYIENSGSMDGYVASGGTLSDAVYSYVSRLSAMTDTTRLFYINSTAIPYSGSLSGFIRDLTPEAFSAAGGNRTASDMAQMIDHVLSQTNDSTVTMFVSDCILDLPNEAGTTASRLNNRRIAISNSVSAASRRVDSLGIVVMKMTSPFNGRYFYPDGRATTLTNLERPYYIWLAGNRDVLAEMLRKAQPIDIVGNGFKEIAGFTTPVRPRFEIVNAAGNGGRCSAVGGKYTFYINADLRPTLQPTYVLTDTAAYSTVGTIPGLRIDRVGTITREDSPYNIFIELSLDENSRIDMDRVTFNPPILPAWVKESDDNTGAPDAGGRNDRTFGLAHLLTGVSEGFNSKGPLARFEFKIAR